MDIISVAQAALLGLVEGLTEFLPVSSTGHLILLIDLLGFAGPSGKLFEIVIQLGAILAVSWVYRGKLLATAAHLHDSAPARHFTAVILAAFLPSMVVGALAYRVIKNVLFSPLVVSTMLVVGGVAMLLIERFRPVPRFHAAEEITLRRALAVGFFQCVAMIPGVSRAAATIMGGMLMGIDRRTATEFSFFLAIPTMVAATAYDLYKNWHDLDTQGLALIGIGFLCAFVTALIVVRTAIGFVGRHGFAPFAYYRIALGLVMLGILLYRTVH
ncbi:undecaprenyl-diphosphate phosphatase [Dongia sp.]|uniref:undecaprenyl-diphosphate phosphatase n=1 Tax=Dongia sp. TaxID=1977262 RepID=UPI0035B3EAC8